MLILPDVPRSDWRAPSLALPKDMFGRENRTRFRLTARLDDGAIRWRGWFDSRDDADAFLYALILHLDGVPMPRADWHLPSPMWSPDLGEGLTYDFATVTFLVAPTGSNQTYNKPADFNDASNLIETIGGGASGGAVLTLSANSGAASGGAGAAYNRKANLTLGATATYQIAAGGASVTTGTTGTATRSDGNNGGDTWFNNATLAGSSCGSKGGGKGFGKIGGVDAAASTHGASASGTGDSGFNGGDGGAVNAGVNLKGATGGAGAGGAVGAGNSSTASASNPGVATAGASGDIGSGGSGSAASTTGTSSAGGNGTEWDGSHGSGGGSGGSLVSATNPAVSGAGGNYGAGSGGAVRTTSTTNSGTSGLAGSGIIVITYTPAPHAMPFQFTSFNASLAPR